MSGLLSLIFTLPALAQEDTAAEVSAEPEAPLAEPLLHQRRARPCEPV